MRKQLFCIVPVLFICLIFLSACANRNSSSNSSQLVHGFKQGGASSAPPLADTADAKVIMVKPGVVAIHDGRAENLQPGMLIPISAILRSDATGTAQLSFNDGTTLDISPNSEIAVAEIAPVSSNKTDSGASAKGLFRKLGGRFGSSTSTASSQTSIGIRGLK